MDSLQEIMGRKNFQAPDEVKSIKEYILRRYKSRCSVRLERDSIVLLLPGSALAATVQLEREQLIEACNINKKLFIRNG
jgi:hypothetical protein